jgi:hypothetical protein
VVSLNVKAFLISLESVRIFLILHELQSLKEEVVCILSNRVSILKWQKQYFESQWVKVLISFDDTSMIKAILVQISGSLSASSVKREDSHLSGGDGTPHEVIPIDFHILAPKFIFSSHLFLRH